MPWWNETQAIIITGKSGAILYGEIKVTDGIDEGDIIEEGFLIGTVLTVLKKDKGRPMSMLHIELHKPELAGLFCWESQKPESLLDPTSLLIKSANLKVIKTSHKPFKSGSVINTIKGIIDHPVLHIPAYIFEEDELELYQEEKKEEQEVLKFGDLKIGEVYFCRSQSTYDGSVLDLDAKILSLDGFKDGKRFAVALSEDKEWCVKISEDQMKFVQKKKQIKWTNLYLKDSKNSIESGGLYNTEENAVRSISDKSNYLKTISIEI
jgi:hypothetical protein